MSWLLIILGMSSAGVPSTIVPIPITNADQCGNYIPVGREGFCMTVEGGSLIITDILPKH